MSDQIKNSNETNTQHSDTDIIKVDIKFMEESNNHRKDFTSKFLASLTHEEQEKLKPIVQEFDKLNADAIKELKETGQIRLNTIDRIGKFAENKMKPAFLDPDGNGVVDERHTKLMTELSKNHIVDPKFLEKEQKVMDSVTTQLVEKILGDNSKATEIYSKATEIYSGEDFKQLLEKAGLKGDKAFIAAQKALGGSIEVADLNENNRMDKNDAFRIPLASVNKLHQMAEERGGKR